MNYMKSLGGNDRDEKVTKILRACISDSYASTVTLEGRLNKKNAFKDSMLYYCLKSKCTLTIYVNKSYTNIYITTICESCTE